ncbi:DsbA family protein [Pseudonocardia abyssalis]|jgi:protein-disulfide isomerase|uniref:Thioredoxin domain-containing protein n=1 Tax=Pseudonocardia abyssalis TaxID=2792008 RepID=A0ABS6UVN0_9PSEU|nr:thioredoxin domain-containing protein [Pseudonocardia abyssalis]MBW0118896.1 thioredoxin domain-containing protein [Pseudonocardia abyssalis]MBW0136313.1 thioredoxin domain-containing protein [Pseudonocardia abyssalis]
MGGASRNEKKRKQEAANARLRAAGITPRKGQQTGDGKRTTFIAVAVLAVVALVVGVVVLVTRDSGDTASAPTYTASTADGVVTAGSGPIVVDVYEDFLCPVCERFEERYGQELTDAMNAGQITVRYHSVAILDELTDPVGYSSRAANAALCAVPAGIYPAYHSRLFDEQPAERSSGLTDEQLTAFGTELGADLGACIGGAANADAVASVSEAATSDAALRNADGDFGTPTVLLDGARVDISDTGWLQKALAS